MAEQERIDHLEKRIDSLEENITFIKNLLSHIHKQFQEFKQDIDNKLK